MLYEGGALARIPNNFTSKKKQVESPQNNIRVTFENVVEMLCFNIYFEWDDFCLLETIFYFGKRM